MSERSELEPLDPAVAALLDEERRASAPDASRDRVRARLAATLGAAALGGASASAQPGPTATPPVGATVMKAAPLAGKALAIKVVAGLVGAIGLGFGVHAVLHRAPAPAPAPLVAAPPPTTTPAAPAVAPAPSVPSAVPAPAAPEAAPPRPRANDLAGERRLLDEGRAALARGDATAALAALSRHRRRYPRGQLAEERDALEVRALAAAGRLDEARARADRFRAHHPHSIFLPAVDATAPASSD